MVLIFSLNTCSFSGPKIVEASLTMELKERLSQFGVCQSSLLPAGHGPEGEDGAPGGRHGQRDGAELRPHLGLEGGHLDGRHGGEPGQLPGTAGLGLGGLQRDGEIVLRVLQADRPLKLLLLLALGWRYLDLRLRPWKPV